MKRLFLIVFVAVSANAGVTFFTSEPPLGSTVARGSLVRFQFDLSAVQVDEHDIRPFLADERDRRLREALDRELGRPPRHLLQVVKRDVPLPFGEIGTHAV